jgi:hypothetical protein
MHHLLNFPGQGHGNIPELKFGTLNHKAEMMKNFVMKIHSNLSLVHQP